MTYEPEGEQNDEDHDTINILGPGGSPVNNESTVLVPEATPMPTATPDSVDDGTEDVSKPTGSETTEDSTPPPKGPVSSAKADSRLHLLSSVYMTLAALALHFTLHL